VKIKNIVAGEILGFFQGHLGRINSVKIYLNPPHSFFPVVLCVKKIKNHGSQLRHFIADDIMYIL
jgi:hypothetical protein